MYGEIREEEDDDENEGVEADEDVKLTANVSCFFFMFCSWAGWEETW